LFVATAADDVGQSVTKHLLAVIIDLVSGKTRDFMIKIFVHEFVFVSFSSFSIHWRNSSLTEDRSKGLAGKQELCVDILYAWSSYCCDCFHLSNAVC